MHLKCYDCIAKTCEVQHDKELQSALWQIAFSSGVNDAITIYHGKALCSTCLEEYMHEV